MASYALHHCYGKKTLAMKPARCGVQVRSEEWREWGGKGWSEREWEEKLVEACILQSCTLLVGSIMREK